MQLFTSYKAAFQSCMETKSFAIAHLINLKKRIQIDTTGCYKIFFCLSGDKKFHINNSLYDVEPNDLFFISLEEWHFFSHYDEGEQHDRYVIFIYPDYLHMISSEKTDLSLCFLQRGESDVHLKYSLSKKNQERMIYYLHNLIAPEEYGSDLLEKTLFVEFMVFLNKLVLNHQGESGSVPATNYYNKTSNEILAYLNAHITEDLSINALAEHFFLSPAYLCKSFKTATGTTIHKYVVGQRITLAKGLLAEGHPTLEVSLMCGFNDYNAFLKAFTKEVGISPKKYSQLSL